MVYPDMVTALSPESQAFIDDEVETAKAMCRVHLRKQINDLRRRHGQPTVEHERLLEHMAAQQAAFRGLYDAMEKAGLTIKEHLGSLTERMYGRHKS